MQGAYGVGLRAWPSIQLERGVFEAYVAERLGDVPLDDGQAESLYLACACARGDAEAVAQLDRRYLRDAPYLRRFGDHRGFVDDVLQDLRERLFVEKRIADYSGRGSLEGWLRVAAVRLAIDRTRKAQVLPEVELDHEPLVDAPDPELALLKSQHADEFASALAEVLRSLDADDRTMLRFYLTDKLTLAEIGALFRVNRTTIVRRLVECRRRILEDTRGRLIDGLKLSSEEADSLMRRLQSQLDVSIHRMLESPKLTG
jgi:RNA polymerase sigma-70 factor (ECF subfamily)